MRKYIRMNIKSGNDVRINYPPTNSINKGKPSWMF